LFCRTSPIPPKLSLLDTQPIQCSAELYNTYTISGIGIFGFALDVYNSKTRAKKSPVDIFPFQNILPLDPAPPQDMHFPRKISNGKLIEIHSKFIRLPIIKPIKRKTCFSFCNLPLQYFHFENHAAYLSL